MISGISGISGVQGYQALNRAPLEHTAHQAAHASAETGDTVSINSAVNMSDEEARQILQEVSADIGSNHAEALSVHQGLDYDRVMALIGGL